jgi:hypothetical protein
MLKAQSALLNLIVLVLSQKGGVGKSTVAGLLLDAYRSTAIRVAAYDSDGSVGTLLRVHGSRDDAGNLLEAQDPLQGVGFYDIRGLQRNQLLDSITGGDPLILHDVAGGALGDITTVVDGGVGVSGLLEAYEEHGYRVTILHVLSPTAASTQSISRHLEVFGDAVDHVVVRNRFWGNQFPFWTGFIDGAGVQRGGKTRDRFLAMGGIEIDFPTLPSATFAKWDASNCSPSMAVRSTLLSITEKSQIKKFRQEFWSMVQPARSKLAL